MILIGTCKCTFLLIKSFDNLKKLFLFLRILNFLQIDDKNSLLDTVKSQQIKKILYLIIYTFLNSGICITIVAQVGWILLKHVLSDKNIYVEPTSTVSNYIF